MFVTQSKYDKLLAKSNELAGKYDRLVDMWNDVIQRVNDRGGEAFINGEISNSQLSNEDIKKLLILCHPDKHDGKKLANEMTAFLNELNRK